MSGTKEKVLYELLKNKGSYISGEAIADKYAISRVAVAKAIKGLTEDGYVFDAVRNKGYSIITAEDILSAELILDGIKNKNTAVQVFDKITSTNTYAKEQILIASTDFLIVSNSQTFGRGRLGREFLSPANDGVYMSLAVQKPNISSAGIVTMFAAVAVSRVIDRIFNVKTDIKWVNDIYLGGKKLCGILCEGVLNFETAVFDWVIIGIGINVFNKNMDEKIAQIAVSLGADKAIISRNKIISEICNELMMLLRESDQMATVDEYKRKSFIIGKKIVAIRGDERIEGRAVDIQDNGNLIVERDNGEKLILIAGDVSVKMN